MYAPCLPAHTLLPLPPLLQLDPAVVQRLQALLLGSRVSTVRLIRKCPGILEREWADLTTRLVGMKARGRLETLWRASAQLALFQTQPCAAQVARDFGHHWLSEL